MTAPTEKTSIEQKQLRALLVEDSEMDAQLLVRHLKQAGFDLSYHRVDTAEEMNRALEQQQWDVVISDYSMPRFDAPTALATLQAKNLDVPFIIVSGTMREEMAAQAMRSGAHDFFVKGELGGRLAAAIEREVQEAKVRADNLKMHQQLLISDAMASIGTLAAGIAHELNNPLASVTANLDLALASLPALTEALGGQEGHDELLEELRDAREGAERIRNIVRDLRVFSRSEDTDCGPVALPKVLDSTLRMAWNEIRHRARLVKNYGPTPEVDASESRLGQIFLNLVVNAAQAITNDPAKKRHSITVTTKTSETGDAIVEVTDTGPGIPPEVMRDMFRPFFTTKPIGVGTGLGLPICNRLVSDVGGSIEVESTLGEGTTFRILLPAASRPSTTLNEPAVPTPVARRARVLVVDDEPMIGNAVKRALGKEHEIVPALSAEEALAYLATDKDIDLVLCDLLMPQMTGMELYEVLRGSDPQLAEQMIFLTGGAFTTRAKAFLDEVPNQRIEKPFDPLHLRALLNDRLR